MVWYSAVAGTGVPVPYLPDLAERSGVLARLPSARVGAETLGARADTGRVAYVGHSVGGSAAAMGCAISARLDACVNLDGWPVPATARSGFPAAYLHVEETRPYRTDGQLDDWGVTRAEYDRNMTGLIFE